jgi:RNA polymerase sigma factor (sigma-70 family)
MIAAETMVSLSDSELVQRSLLGDGEAFGQIVSRYQALICSLAYSATGNLGQSEDLAQETFITAWNRLSHLRERHRLGAWLCGIARNRINNAIRHERREPLRAAEPLDAVHEWAEPGPLPRDYAVSNEEAAILWRSLERLPETYRTPLILFYREHRSIETVAAHLDLTEDAVKQRLARGRKLLREQVLAFVEGALARSNPGKAFTIAVLASLPGLAFSVKAAAVGATATTGSAAAKTAGASGLLGAMMGPLIVFVPNYFGYRLALSGAQSDEERAGIKSVYGRVGVITLAVFLPVMAVVFWLTRSHPDPSFLSGLLATLLVLIFLPTMFVFAVASSRKDRRYYSRASSQGTDLSGCCSISSRRASSSAFSAPVSGSSSSSQPSLSIWAILTRISCRSSFVSLGNSSRISALLMGTNYSVCELLSFGFVTSPHPPVTSAPK